MLPEFSLVNADGKKLPWNNHEISASILAESNGKIKLETQIPIISITSVWHPGQFSIPPVKLPWFLGNKCGANTSLPLLVFLDQNYSVRYAVGLTNGIDDTEFTCKMNQELCCFEVSFTISVCKETEPFEIFFDNSGGSLKTVLQKYRGKIIPEIPDYPSAAWEPVYCTWYAVHAALTKEYLKSNAQEAADLGFGTFIVDDGWCYKESKRVTPATLPDWYQDIGDWKYSEEKLPGLKNIVEHAQKLGLNYMFWVAPFFSGKRSELNGKISSFVTELHEGQRVYDPADEAADAITEKSIFEIFRLMELDGLKIDFIDMIPPDVDHPRCRKVKKYLESLIGKIRKEKPEALIEFRQNYATPVNAGLATAFRAGDVPFDYMENFSRCVQLRLILGDKIPVHADPVYFNDKESSEGVGRHMIASLAGVPMLSMDLKKLSSIHRNVIKNYISFYREHQETLNSGLWDFLLQNGYPAAGICRNEKETIYFLSEERMQYPEENNGKLIILNMGLSPIPFTGKIYDAEGKIFPGNMIPSGGRGIL